MFQSSFHPEVKNGYHVAPSNLSADYLTLRDYIWLPPHIYIILSSLKEITLSENTITTNKLLLSIKTVCLCCGMEHILAIWYCYMHFSIDKYYSLKIDTNPLTSTQLKCGAYKHCHNLFSVKCNLNTYTCMYGQDLSWSVKIYFKSGNQSFLVAASII